MNKFILLFGALVFAMQAQLSTAQEITVKGVDKIQESKLDSQKLDEISQLIKDVSSLIQDKQEEVDRRKQEITDLTTMMQQMSACHQLGQLYENGACTGGSTTTGAVMMTQMPSSIVAGSCRTELNKDTKAESYYASVSPGRKVGNGCGCESGFTMHFSGYDAKEKCSDIYNVNCEATAVFKNYICVKD